MSPASRDALKHVGKVLLVVAGICVAYTFALAALFPVRPEGAFGEVVPRAVSLRACLTEGWRTALYQPLFWLAGAVVGSLYNLLTDEIDPQQ
jgi:hypothetical protein